MPKDEFDFEDPMELVGVELPVASEDSDREMVRCFAEEFLRMGLTGAGLLDLFRSPFYSGAHGAYMRLGEAEVRAIIAETEAVLRPRRPE
jgi:hypothetical protein